MLLLLFSPTKVADIVQNMIGNKLKTKQTVGDGVTVSKVRLLFNCNLFKNEKGTCIGVY